MPLNQNMSCKLSISRLLRLVALSICALGLCAGSSCSKKRSDAENKTSTVIPTGQPGDALKRLALAIKNQDCKLLMASVTGPLEQRMKKQGCAKVMRFFKQHGFQLYRIVRSTVDGRNSNVRIVEAEMRVKNAKKIIPIPIRAVNGTWRVGNM